MPVDLRLETQDAPVEYHALPQLRIAGTSDETHGVRVQVDGLQVGEILDRVQVAEVQVPRVPAGRVVVVKLEQVARSAQHLEAGLLVPDRCQEAQLVPLNAEDVVLHAAGGDRHGRGFRSRGVNRPAVGRRTCTIVRGRVEDGDTFAIACDRLESSRGDVLGAGNDLPQIVHVVFVNPVDARTGKDVVELVQQRRLPHRFELASGVLVAGSYRPHLGVA